MSDYNLTHLKQLEAESIHIIREVVAEFDNPVMLYSIGKDSAVLLHLSLKAFHPAKIPFPLLHVDTTWKFKEMIEFRENYVRKELGLDVLVYTNEEGLKHDIKPWEDSERHTELMKTDALKTALDKYGFDAAFGGARRDEEKSRAKERVFSFRDKSHRWDPKNQRPELWNLYNGRVNKGESIRVFPMSNWTELDVWQYIHLEEIPIVPLYLSASRPVIKRDGIYFMRNDDRMPLLPGEVEETKMVRFRTLGCYPLSGAVESEATTLPEVIQEMLFANNQRKTRTCDRSRRRRSWNGREETSRLLLKNIASYELLAYGFLLRSISCLMPTAITLTATFLMSHKSELIATDIDAYLKQHEHKQLLRFITCGSVDDGKSTLIGRLLYDSKMIYEDQLSQLEADSKKVGTVGGDFDPALLTDGLKAEREQGITIDVAYRYFSTAKRKFIIADTPGHEQYTRNMATGASSADLAIILIDARHGVLTQTKRHSFIVSLLGIRHVIVAVNKMDIESVDYSEDRFNEICDDYRSFAARLDLPDLHFIPISALKGDNLVDRSENMPWYSGSTLMNFLETVYIGSDRNLQDFRMPVQYVNRPDLNFRGFCGTVASGIIRPGEEIMVLPSRQKSKVKDIVTYDGNLDEAFTPLSVTITLEDEIDASRGDVIVRSGNLPKSRDQIDAMLVWMNEEAMVPGKTYLFKHTTQTLPGTINTLKYKVDVNSLHREPAPTLDLNEIGRVSISLSAPIHFDAYRRNRSMGAFIVVDRITNATVAAGMILDKSGDGDKQSVWDDDLSATQSEDPNEVSAVTAEERSARFGQKPATVLLTGLTGSGKTAIAHAVERKLFDTGRAAAMIDGESVRRGLSRDLGYSADDRSENLRRSAHLAHTLNQAGLICVASFVAPAEDVRLKVAKLIGEDQFLVVHVATPIEVCRQRDTKGQYAKADAGELRNFPGVTAEYQAPTSPDLVVDGASQTVDECAEAIIKMLKSKDLIR